MQTQLIQTQPTQGAVDPAKIKEALSLLYGPGFGLVVSFRVKGNPAPQGSKRFIPTRKDGLLVTGENSRGMQTVKGRVIDTNTNLKEWRAEVEDAVRAVLGKRFKMLERGPFELAVWYELIFRRPLHHHTANDRTRGLKKGRALLPHTQKPDLTKIVRGVEDSQSDLVWADDCMCNIQMNHKRWQVPGESPGAIVRVYKRSIEA